VLNIITGIIVDAVQSEDPEEETNNEEVEEEEEVTLKEVKQSQLEILDLLTEISLKIEKDSNLFNQEFSKHRNLINELQKKIDELSKK
jgi:hypothetical protein